MPRKGGKSYRKKRKCRLHAVDYPLPKAEGYSLCVIRPSVPLIVHPLVCLPTSTISSHPVAQVQ